MRAIDNSECVLIQRAGSHHHRLRGRLCYLGTVLFLLDDIHDYTDYYTNNNNGEDTKHQLRSELASSHCCTAVREEGRERVGGLTYILSLTPDKRVGKGAVSELLTSQDTTRFVKSASDNTYIPSDPYQSLPISVQL